MSTTREAFDLCEIVALRLTVQNAEEALRQAGVQEFGTLAEGVRMLAARPATNCYKPAHVSNPATIVARDGLPVDVYFTLGNEPHALPINFIAAGLGQKVTYVPESREPVPSGPIESSEGGDAD